MKIEYIDISDTNSIHHIPHNDIEYHSKTINCICNPKIHTIDNVLIITHNAFDGREALEECYLKRFRIYNPNGYTWWVCKDNEYPGDIYHTSAFIHNFPIAKNIISTKNLIHSKS